MCYSPGGGPSSACTTAAPFTPSPAAPPPPPLSSLGLSTGCSASSSNPKTVNAMMVLCSTLPAWSSCTTGPPYFSYCLLCGDGSFVLLPGFYSTTANSCGVVLANPSAVGLLYSFSLGRVGAGNCGPQGGLAAGNGQGGECTAATPYSPSASPLPASQPPPLLMPPPPPTSLPPPSRPRPRSHRPLKHRLPRPSRPHHRRRHPRLSAAWASRRSALQSLPQRRSMP